MGSRFVQPETTWLTLSNGDRLLVKKRLNAGEQRAAHARMYVAGINGETRVNPLQVGLAMTTAYLLDWTLTDNEGKAVEIRGMSPEDIGRVLDSLSPEDFGEINDAVAKHEQAMQAEREAQKKTLSSVSGSSVTGPSLDASGSLSTQSVN